MIPVPVAFDFSGRYAVKVGVTALNTTVPTGVFFDDLFFLCPTLRAGSDAGPQIESLRRNQCGKLGQTETFPGFSTNRNW
jgi:hypothetical protein